MQKWKMRMHNPSSKGCTMYNAKKQGFLNGCKPFIRLDGCHLKGRFCGQLLFATTKDGNDNIFPVAVAVVEQENKDN